MGTSEFESSLDLALKKAEVNVRTASERQISDPVWFSLFSSIVGAQVQWLLTSSTSEKLVGRFGVLADVTTAAVNYVKSIGQLK